MADAITPNGTATPPDFSLDEPMQDSAEFLATIVRDDWDQTKEGKWRWHLGFKPADFDVQGETQMLHDWYGLTDKKNSKMGALREAMAALPDVFPIGQGVKIGQGHYNGIVCWWTKTDIEFGKNRQTGEVYKSEGVHLPIRAATPEEIERARKRAAGGAVAPAAVDNTPVDLTDDQITQVIDVLNGHTKQEVQMALAREPGKSLPREIKSAILAGTLPQQLIEMGALTMTGDTYEIAQVPA